jgi:hypothetical protein
VSCDCRPGPHGCVHAWRPPAFPTHEPYRSLRERLHELAVALEHAERVHVCLIDKEIADELRVASGPLLLQVEPAPCGSPLVQLVVRDLDRC